MIETECPWCAAVLRVDPTTLEAGGSCPECLTSWSYEDGADEQAELPMAA